MGCSARVLLGLLLVSTSLAGDVMHRSIVFNPGTPDVFYCPPYKPQLPDGMLVAARPLSKLCEFKGRPLPDNHQSDCYNDVDETEYACAEKHRLLPRLKSMEEELNVNGIWRNQP